MVWNCPDVSSEISSFAAKDTVGKCPNVSFKILVSVDIFNRTSGHFPDVSVSTFVPANMVWNCCNVKNINFCSHKHGWKMSWSLIRNIWFCCQKHSWKTSSCLVKNVPFCWQLQGCRTSPCVQISLYVAINTAGKCFDVLFKILVSGDINSAWKYPWRPVKNVSFCCC